MAENPWAWQDGRNPYRATPFQILDLAPDTLGRAAVHARIRRRRQRVSRAPERNPLFGEQLAVADVNEAAEQIQDPRGRLLAELRTHRPERSEGRSRFAERVAGIEPPAAPEPPAAVRAQDLVRLAPEPVPRSFPRMWPHGE
ncbi:hypothetical protein [Streptomonospora litoralis]|uniref:Uncharacterized protein n=1 Tax=Streptomonospora litoralis TaxID=2498135 RepID=A0A4P6PZ73_9ACTN|nr:hypothetical protein [Streptomonospora litoralis]QBI53040.1 hypothetical protein EKD16_06210 [Streptomonospora litoralis]